VNAVLHGNLRNLVAPCSDRKAPWGKKKGQDDRNAGIRSDYADLTSAVRIGRTGH
jgi:hypothetical protein